MLILNFSAGGYCTALFSGLPQGVSRDAFCRDRSKEEDIAGHPSYHMQDYDQVLNPGTHQFYRYGSGKKGRSTEGIGQRAVEPSAEILERDGLIDRSGEPLVEDGEPVKRDAVDEEDMCVPKSDGGNTCD